MRCMKLQERRWEIVCAIAGMSLGLRVICNIRQCFLCHTNLCQTDARNFSMFDDNSIAWVDCFSCSFISNFVLDHFFVLWSAAVSLCDCTLGHEVQQYSRWFLARFIGSASRVIGAGGAILLYFNVLLYIRRLFAVGDLVWAHKSYICVIGLCRILVSSCLDLGAQNGM